jgi:FtsZ-binding cell division protein ZapB
MAFPKVTEASARQDYLNIKASYDRAVTTIKELQAQVEQLTAERNSAQHHADALTWERDKVREAWHKAQEQVAREQEMTRQAFKNCLELTRSGRQYNAVIRCAMSPEQWLDAVEAAKERYPGVFDKEAR